jgi:long-chain acyl-CoA synthetase
MDPKIGRLELVEKLLDTPPAACIRIISETESFDFSKEIEIREQPWKDGEEDLSDVCTMIYSAADDGYAKAAMLTHENMLADARAVVEGNNILLSSNSCALLPLSHLYGLQVGLIIPFIASSKFVIADESELTSPLKIEKLFLGNNPSHLYSIPIVLHLLCKLKNLQNLLLNAKSIISGGYSLSNEISEKISKKYSINIREGYGLSEGAPVCTLNSPNQPFKAGSIGRALNCCTIKIVDDNESDVASNQHGEIVVQGGNIMKGYYRHVDSTKEVLANKWLHTGDLGYMDKDGDVYFIKLKKRMINYSGMKIYPAEVERLLKKNYNIKSVYVYGLNDMLLGQKAYANICLHNNSSDEQEKLKKWCHENISRYKIPSKVEFT